MEELKEQIQEIKQRVDRLEEKNNKLEKENRKLREKLYEETNSSPKPEDNKMTRRKFLKMLGVGAGGLALSSSVAGLEWSVLQPANQGTSDINAEVASGLKSSVVGDGLKNGQTSALSIEPADFAGSYLQDDGSDNLQVDTTSIATRTWVNNNADVPNADYADSAGNADTLDGIHANEFANTYLVRSQALITRP